MHESLKLEIIARKNYSTVDVYLHNEFDGTSVRLDKRIFSQTDSAQTIIKALQKENVTFVFGEDKTVSIWDYVRRPTTNKLPILEIFVYFEGLLPIEVKALYEGFCRCFTEGWGISFYTEDGMLIEDTNYFGIVDNI